MSSEWFYQVMNEAVGPVPAAEVKAKVAKGIIGPDTLIRKGADGKWLRAEYFPGLGLNGARPHPVGGSANDIEREPRALANSGLLGGIGLQGPVERPSAPPPLPQSERNAGPPAHIASQPVLAEQPKTLLKPRTTTSWQGLVIVVLLLIAVGLMIGSLSRPKAKWEYLIVSPSDAVFKTEMDMLGDSGWELVSARRATSGDSISYEMIFKRPK